MVERLLTQITEFLPPAYRLSLETCVGEVETSVFPELNFSADKRNWSEMDNGLLSFKTPQLGLFSNAGKKAIYVLCVKVSNLLQIQSVRESKWQEIFGLSTSPQRLLEDPVQTSY